MSEKKEGIDAAFGKCEEVGAENRRVGGAKRPLKVAVSVRQQTPEEERKCTAGIQLLLTEMVRQQLGYEREK